MVDDEDDGFVQKVSGDEDDEFDRKLEESYQRYKENKNSRPNSNKGGRPETAGKKQTSTLDRALSHEENHPIVEQASKEEGEYTGGDKQKLSENKEQKNTEEEEEEEEGESEGELNEREDPPQHEEFPPPPESESKNDGFYTEFSNFVVREELKRDDFCRPVNTYMPENELLDCFKAVNYPITKKEVHKIFKDFDSHQSGFLNMEDFYNRLTCWEDYEEFKYDVERLKAEAAELADQGSKKMKKKGKDDPDPKIKVKKVKKAARIRPFSSNVYNKKISSIGETSYNSNAAFSQQTSYKDQTMKHLKEARLKREQEENELKLVIAKGKRKQQFDCLTKMGEACEIAKTLDIPVNFTTQKQGDELLIYKITVSQYGEDKKELLPMDDFIREYKKLKRLQNSVKSNFTGAFSKKGGSTAISHNAIVSSYTLTRINKDERQKELREVLKDTMKLTKKLKEQLQILEAKGVCGVNRLASHHVSQFSQYQKYLMKYLDISK